MLTGGCQCGAVRYRSDGEPGGLYACHCRECQKLSVSAFSLSLLVPRSGFHLIEGTPKSWTRPTASGQRLDCYFCPHCGSRVWHDAPHEPWTITIKAGSLDEPVDLGEAIHIWTSRRLPGVMIPADTEQWPEEPGENAKRQADQ